MRYFFLLFVLLISSAAELGASEALSGIVRKVYDGDTILLAVRGNSRFSVRLYGIDAPETSKPDKPGQPFGAVAKRTLMYKLLGREVSAEIVENDSYGRTVAVIRHKGRDINLEMVDEGLAWAYRRYLDTPYASDYIAAEDRARRLRRGLWRDRNPIPPWEFRHIFSEPGK